jgi:hypothetical protein
MHTTFNIFEKILRIMAQNPEKNYTLEGLTNLVKPYSAESLQAVLSVQIMNQAQVFEAFMILNTEGLIILDSDSDKSIISLSGLIHITSKSFLN